MALRTIISQLALVNIFMTGCTLVFRNRGRNLKDPGCIRCTLMAFETIYGCMLSFQRKISCVVIKASFPYELRKRSIGVTLGTFTFDAAIMGILMARNAVTMRNIGKLLKLSSIFRARFVTRFAINTDMLAAQFEFGFVMIKL
jgi:hypothetical protein